MQEKANLQNFSQFITKRIVSVQKEFVKEKSSRKKFCKVIFSTIHMKNILKSQHYTNIFYQILVFFVKILYVFQDLSQKKS